MIVIGAGALGCCAAWHLRQKGLQVTLLEAEAGPATQTTAAGAGFVAHWSAIHVPGWEKTEWEMQHYGIEFYRRLSQDHPQDFGFRAHGIAYIYRDEEALEAVQPRAEQARRFGTRLERLSPTRAAKLLPLIRFDRVAGILYDPDSVRVSAGDAIRALCHRLEQAGVRCSFGTRVREFRRDGDRIIGVVTDRGPFQAAETVVAAGVWSRPLLGALGVPCPAQPRVETRYVTQPLPEVKPDLPLLMFVDQGRLIRGRIYVREERGGLLVGAGELGPLPPDRQVDPESPPRVDGLPSTPAYRTRESIRPLEAVMPVLQQAEIAEIRCGLPTYTVDRHFIVGRVPGWQGLSVVAGCQEAGITHGPALGRLIAGQIAGEESEWDASAYRPDRFAAPAS